MTAIVIKRGDTCNMLFSALDAEGSPQPLTGCTARLQLRIRAGSVPVVDSTSSPENGLVLDEAAGTISWTLDATTTATLEAKNYSGDLELAYPSGDRRSTETFTVKIVDDITREIPS